MLGLLGKGAMGQVYKAVEPSLNRLVAIKVLPAKFQEDDDQVERFEREAQAVALLSHPNVVQIIDKDREGDLLYFVMEYVPGTSLDAVMSQRRLSLHEVFRVAKSICRGLEAAHRQNIVHRDLNPRNVLVSEDLSVVKLADFGISRVEDVSLLQGTLSTSEVSLGSLYYMSPEQSDNMVEADHRTDIYSLGVILYEMLTGRVPVGRFSLPSQINNEVPSDVDPLVLKCLEADPADRYATVTQVLGELNRLEDKLKLGLVHELKGFSQQTSKIFLKSTGTFRGRKRQLVIAAVALLVLAGGSAAFILRRRAAPAQKVAVEPVDGREIVSFELPERPQEGGLETSSDSLAEVLPAPLETPPAALPTEQQPDPEPAATASSRPPTTAASTRAEEDLGVARDKLAAGLNGPALEDLQQFVEEHTSSPLIPEAYMLMAKAHQEEGRTEQALATYVEIGSRFADSPQAPAAAFERARLVEQGAGKEASQEARLLFAAVAADHPGANWAPAALAAKARIENELKMMVTDPVLELRVPASVLPCRALVELYPSTAEAEWAFWQLGEIYADLKRYELAAQSFDELGRRFPKTKFQAWWRAGQIYDRRLGQTTQALEAYRQVRPSSAHYGEAQKRIGRLER